MTVSTDLTSLYDRGEWPTPNQLKVTRKAGCMRHGVLMSPAELPETVRTTLKFIVNGYQIDEIARERSYTRSAIQKHITALLVVFNARNTNHLSALAVSQGIVSV